MIIGAQGGLVFSMAVFNAMKGVTAYDLEWYIVTHMHIAATSNVDIIVINLPSIEFALSYVYLELFDNLSHLSQRPPSSKVS